MVRRIKPTRPTDAVARSRGPRVPLETDRDDFVCAAGFRCAPVLTKLERFSITLAHHMMSSSAKADDPVTTGRAVPRLRGDKISTALAVHTGCPAGACPPRRRRAGHDRGVGST